MRFEIGRTTQETFRVDAEDPKDALEFFVPGRDRANEMTTVSLKAYAVGGETLVYADHPKFPDHKIKLTDDMIEVRAPNGDTVFSARIVQEDSEQED